MSKRIIDAQALRQSIIANAVGASKVADKVTAKGQRNALAKVATASAVAVSKEVWSVPASFGGYCEAEGLPFSTVIEAMEIAKGDDASLALEALRALASHRAYRAERFDEAFTVSDIDRLVRREIGYQRFGGIELGLGGYSAEDVVQMAIVRSWNEALTRYLSSTGQVTDEEAEVMKQALDKRSLIDFTDAIEASDFVRYDLRERDGYMSIITRDASKMNERIVRQAEAFADLASMLNEQAGRIEFTIGSVYRHIIKVRRDGVAAIRRMLEGYTPDGTFTASSEFSASERNSYEFRSAVNANLEQSLIVASAENDFISKSFTVQDERAELIEALLASDLVPAEAEAVAFISLLNDGYSIAELKEEVFADLTSRRFGAMVKTAQELLRK
jgi:hypothetical protein